MIGGGQKVGIRHIILSCYTILLTGQGCVGGGGGGGGGN